MTSPSRPLFGVKKGHGLDLGWEEDEELGTDGLMGKKSKEGKELGWGLALSKYSSCNSRRQTARTKTRSTREREKENEAQITRGGHTQL